MKPVVEICLRNISKGSDILLQDEWLNQHADVITEGCLQFCELCADSFFVLVEGELISSRQADELLNLTKQAVAAWYQ
ncbi:MULTISPECIES: DUF1450 domain-containing protein [unclassified Enterococcus]|uniref:DUF1450 domain-containing protein n=1 Tax=unclassified Enterococcus TaxID=2608891 RepID=UPI0015519A04|nr:MULTISPECIES: DUF1450 domain-containing protein [unclassified Enterococcus]MBS7577920.1 DUF1450 domain-containing protein [Enterococcus sp. MMGLQ5-2]MBS7585219.1 DUF1450 domain-containing protein [Enterococcus sp. MMGLQ5-1]NPD13076.1 DUF1450 domain-containing protein [Enterococcus sp. MMGLQ5-1]NPD37750.1 DUF1450 domain-containing protein [Enterococcus sp. MMGLQ5-2]